MSRRRNIAKMMARLNVASPNLAPRKGSSGYRESWDREDAATIAHALGLAAARSKGRSTAVDVLCIAWWPAVAEGAEVVTSRTVEQVEVRVKMPRTGREVRIQRAETRVRTARTLQPALVRVHRFVQRALLRKLRRRQYPAKILAKLKGMLADGTLAASVIDEYLSPNHCPRCHGYGVVFRTTNEKGEPCGGHSATCSMCLGQGLVKRGVGRRAAAVKMRTVDYHEHVQESFEAALGLLRYLESRAARDVARALGD